MPISIPSGAVSSVVATVKTFETPTTSGAGTAEIMGRRIPQEKYCRATVTVNTSYLTLPITLPPRCKLDWVQFLNNGAITMNYPAGTTNVPDQYALVNALPATGTTTATTMVIAVSGALTDAAEANVVPSNVVSNTTTSEVTLYLIPIDNGGAEDFHLHTTATSGYHFDSTGSIDVSIFFTQIDSPRE